MSALADAFRALIPIASGVSGEVACCSEARPARNVLRKYAPCQPCRGMGEGHFDIGDGPEYRWCPECNGACWSPASVEAAIKREEERERLDKAVLDAAEAWGNSDDDVADDEALAELAGALIEKLRLGPK